MAKSIRRTIACSSVLFLFFLFQAAGVALLQPKAAEEEGPDIRLGEITFQVRELQSTPSPRRALEVHVEVLNRSRSSTAPANSIRMVVVQKEIKYSGEAATPGFNPTQEETTLTVPLPPKTTRILIFGFSLPEKTPESITFEIQMNPPEGETKTVKWEGSGNQMSAIASISISTSLGSLATSTVDLAGGEDGK
jgi:hypothetical protein